MTEEQFLKKVRELNRTNSRAILAQAQRVVKEDCLPLADADDDYRLPKAFMAAACRIMAWQWRPFTREDQKVSKHIERFI